MGRGKKQTGTTRIGEEEEFKEEESFAYGLALLVTDHPRANSNPLVICINVRLQNVTNSISILENR